MKEHKGKHYSIDRLSQITGAEKSYIRYLKFTKKIPYFQESPGGKILILYDDFMNFVIRNKNEIQEY